MSHPSEGELLALVDGALDEASRRRVQVHVQGCVACRQARHELEQALRGVTVELALVDAGEPAAWRSGDATPLPRTIDEAPRAPENRHRRWEPSRTALPGRSSFALTRAPSATRWAALLLVLVAGGATAMVAPRWGAWRTTASAHDADATSAAPPSASLPVPVATRAAAVSFLPEGARAMVALSSAGLSTGAEGRVRVGLSDRLDVQVTVTTIADPVGPTQAAPRFASADGRLDVQLPGGAVEVLVELPAALRSARITHDGRTIVTVQGGEVRPAGATAEGVALGPATHP